MGKSANGAHGPVKGKVGNLVYTSWRGIPVVKLAPVRTAPPTRKETLNRGVFALTNQWLSPLTPFLRIGFRNYTPTNQGFTAAKSYLSKHALVKDGENPSIDPSKMLVSHGELPPAGNISVDRNAEGDLDFTWDPSVNQGQALLDQVMLLAYNPDEQDSVMSLGGNFRRDGMATLPLGKDRAGEFHLYIAFVAEDRSRQSNSVYLGTVSV